MNQNALGQGKGKRMSETNVIILKTNPYSNIYGRGIKRKVGDVHPCRAEYAQALVDAGVAKWPPGQDIPLGPGESAEVAVATFASVKGISDVALAGLAAVEHTWETVRAAAMADLEKLPGVGPKMAAKLKAEAGKHGQASTD